MLQKLLCAAKEYSLFQNGDKIAVALSGGADSVALLHALTGIREEFGLDISAIHVNHMIRGEEADSDMEFAESLCKGLGVELLCERIDVPAEAKRRSMGLEEAGRVCRYELFEQYASGRSCKIATAHTLSDSTETVLFNLARGSGLAGLCGIPPVRGCIIRPLIRCTREDIEKYCRENSLRFVTDSTNLDTTYSRNLIRLELIPLLKRINPSLNEAVERLSRCAARDEAFLCELAREKLEQLRRAEGYDAAGLLVLNDALRSRALLLACAQGGAEPEFVHIALMEECLKNSCGGVTMPGGVRASVRGGTLLFDSERSESFKNEAQWLIPAIPGENTLPNGKKLYLKVMSTDEYVKTLDLNGTDLADFVNILENHKIYFKNCLDYDIIKDNLYLRNRRSGDRFSPARRGLSKSLKELFREQNIPPDQRSSAAILCSGDSLCWLEGIGASQACRVSKDTKNILVVGTRD